MTTDPQMLINVIGACSFILIFGLSWVGLWYRNKSIELKELKITLGIEHAQHQAYLEGLADEAREWKEKYLKCKKEHGAAYSEAYEAAFIAVSNTIDKRK